jgi:hypothetical protein
MNWLERRRARKAQKQLAEDNKRAEKEDFEHYIKKELIYHLGPKESLETILTMRGIIDKRVQKLEEMDTGKNNTFVHDPRYSYGSRSTIKKLRGEGLVALVDYRNLSGTGSSGRTGTPVKIVDRDPYRRK